MVAAVAGKAVQLLGVAADGLMQDVELDVGQVQVHGQILHALGPCRTKLPPELSSRTRRRVARAVAGVCPLALVPGELIKRLVQQGELGLGHGQSHCVKSVHTH